MDKSPEFTSYDPVTPQSTEVLSPADQLSGAPLSSRYDVEQWRRYVQENTGLVLGSQAPPEDPPEKKKSKPKRPNTPWRWAKTIWMSDWRKRQRERLEQDARESRAGMTTFMALAEYAVGLAASTEPNSEIRNTKRRDMRKKWREYAHDLIKMARE